MVFVHGIWDPTFLCKNGTWSFLLPFSPEWPPPPLAALAAAAFSLSPSPIGKRPFASARPPPPPPQPPAKTIASNRSVNGETAAAALVGNIAVQTGGGNTAALRRRGRRPVSQIQSTFSSPAKSMPSFSFGCCAAATCETAKAGAPRLKSRTAVEMERNGIVHRRSFVRFDPFFRGCRAERKCDCHSSGKNDQAKVKRVEECLARSNTHTHTDREKPKLTFSMKKYFFVEHRSIEQVPKEQNIQINFHM